MSETQTINDTPVVKKISIQGETFELPIRYQEGHTLSAVEAGVLSQTWCENVRNNTAKHIKAAQAEDAEVTMADARKAVEEYAGQYEFTARDAAGSSASMTPVERECRKIAREHLKNLLARDGRKVADVRKDSPEKYDAAVEQLAGAEEVVKLATKRVKEAAKASDSLMENLAMAV